VENEEEERKSEEEGERGATAIEKSPTGYHEHDGAPVTSCKGFAQFSYIRPTDPRYGCPETTLRIFFFLSI